MKKLVLSLLAVVGLAMAAPIYYNGTGGTFPPIPFNRGSSIFTDVTIDTGDVAYSATLDLSKFQAKDSLGIISTRIGALSLLCYDIDDAAAVVDSVRVQAIVQFSAGAGDGANPYSGKSWTWGTATGDTLNLAAASDANASVTGSIANVVASSIHADRFMRLKLTNVSTGGAGYAKNKPRCKAWISSKPIQY